MTTILNNGPVDLGNDSSFQENEFKQRKKKYGVSQKKGKCDPIHTGSEKEAKYKSCEKISLSDLNLYAQSYILTPIRYIFDLFFVFVSFFLRLILVAISITPGGIRGGGAYWWNCKHGSLKYGPRFRNLLDIYLPSDDNGKSHEENMMHKNSVASRLKAKKVPVVVIVTGGAWCIGHRAWVALLSKHLTEYGKVISVSVDYTNWPFGDWEQQVIDLQKAFSYIKQNIGRYGGDVNNMILVGQSCGAHLSLLSLLSSENANSAIKLSNSSGTNKNRTSPKKNDNRESPNKTSHGATVSRRSSGMNSIPENISIGQHTTLNKYNTEDLKSLNFGDSVVSFAQSKRCSEMLRNNENICMFKHYFGWSGVYDLLALQDLLVAKGLRREILSIFVPARTKDLVKKNQMSKEFSAKEGGSPRKKKPVDNFDTISPLDLGDSISKADNDNEPSTTSKPVVVAASKSFSSIQKTSEPADCEYEQMLAEWSPQRWLDEKPELATKLLPPGKMHFFHGSNDTSVGVEQTIAFVEYIKSCRAVAAKQRLQNNPEEVDLPNSVQNSASDVAAVISTELDTHTKSVVEGPLAGNDPVAREVLRIVLAGCEGTLDSGQIDKLVFKREQGQLGIDICSWAMPF